MTLIGLVVVVLVFCVVLWAVQRLLAAFQVGDPIATVVYVVFVLFAIYLVLTSVGALGHGPLLRLG